MRAEFVRSFRIIKNEPRHREKTTKTDRKMAEFLNSFSALRSAVVPKSNKVEPNPAQRHGGAARRAATTVIPVVRSKQVCGDLSRWRGRPIEPVLAAPVLRC